MATRQNRADKTPPALSNDEEHESSFQKFTETVTPLPSPGKAQLARKRPRPIPYQSQKDETQALADSLTDPQAWEPGLEHSEDLWFLRNGVSKQVIRKLRGGHWSIQAQLDLHGMISDEARMQLIQFISDCRKRDLRCVRVIHGKGLGSRNREPVLKRKVRHWLTQKDEVLAFCEASPADGGSGVVIVLLKSNR